ncbi:hypothetical protein [Sulfuricystis multivorans]|uniref:hypothetical protein n=1 Tax=Sulfuricystis multivorans TaxID=2211108 RepID=UPI000F8269DA|nr:hypothetical protein [Sulfuricystis multivorans]
MLLTLPVFAPEVPAVIEFSPAGEWHLRLVLAMSRLGMISDDDLAGLRRSSMSASVIRSLIEKGWQREVGDDYTFKLISAYARLILPHHDEEGEFSTENGEPLVGVAINAGNPEWIAIGKAFSAIEALQAGLGRKALGILERSLCHFGTPHTAGGAFEMAQHLYWCGEDDESVVLKECGDDSDVPRRADLFDGIPEWAYFYASVNLPYATDEEFAEASERLSGHPVGKLLAALLHLNHVDSDNGLFATPYQSDYCSIPNEPPVVCGWHGEDDFDQIFDDNFRYFAESGEEPPWCGCVMFAPTEAGILEALPRIRHTGIVLRALDTALCEARKLNNEL